MKAILVLEMPSSCLECPIGEDMSIPIETCIKCPFGKCVIDEKVMTRPNWCPLNPIPERKGLLKQLPMYDTDTHYEQGYNACIDEILGNKE